MLCDEAKLYVFGKHLRLRPDVSQGDTHSWSCISGILNSSVVQACLRNICCVLLEIDIRRVYLQVCNIYQSLGTCAIRGDGDAM